MKKIFTSNQGATLIELITSITILSIVGISCFTLLMFSIRTNSFITSGTSACRDAEVLNKRLAYLFEDKTVALESDGNHISFALDDNSLSELVWEGSELKYGESTLQDNVTEFSAEVIEGGVLLRVEYTIDDSYTCTKIFSCASCTDQRDTP